MQGQGLRPWRLVTKHAKFFYPAELARLEEERAQEQVMQAAGIVCELVNKDKQQRPASTASFGNHDGKTSSSEYGGGDTQTNGWGVLQK